jgi:EmrB/QacA subfamily drug resistance transporter
MALASNPASSNSASSPTATSRWLALVVLCAGMLMIILDTTIVNVALPSIQRDLGFSQSTLAWVVNAYLIAFGGVLLLAGRFGDLLGQTRVFLAGLVLFTVSSFLCGVSWSQEVLITARFIQGIGGAMTSAVVLGMIVTMFPQPGDRARAISVYSFVASAGASIGLLAGGVLAQALSWHWIFFVNLPIGIVTFVAALRYLERERGIGLAEGADAPGAVLITAALMLGVYAIIRAGDNGWTSPETLAFALASLLALGAFIVRESRTSRPLLPLSVFRSRNLSGANAVMLLLGAAMFGMFFLTSIYLQRVLGLDTFGVGLAFLPVSLSIGALSLSVAAPLIMRFGARNVLLPALGLFAAGLGLLARLPADGSYFRDVLPSMVLFGTGAGLAFPSLVTVAMSDATHRDSGLASGMVNTTRQVGGAIGLAALAALSTSRTQEMLVAGSAQATALTDGFHVAFAVATVLMLGAVGVVAIVLRPAGGSRFEADEQSSSTVDHSPSRRHSGGPQSEPA